MSVKKDNLKADLLSEVSFHKGSPALGEAICSVLDTHFSDDSECSDERINFTYEDVLLWRGIERVNGDKPCLACGGSGARAYANTATWHGGVGGNMITSDICDKCWGSGNAEKPWVNLRQLSR